MKFSRKESRDAAPTRPVKRAVKKSGPKPPSQRQLRVGEEVRHVLSAIFARQEFRDPDLHDVLVTVTEVRMSPDLKHATAFVARLGRTDIDAKLPALRRAAPFFRAQLAHEMRLRVAPDVSFQADAALEYAVHINELLRSVKEGKQSFSEEKDQKTFTS